MSISLDLKGGSFWAFVLDISQVVGRYCFYRTDLQ